MPERGMFSARFAATLLALPGLSAFAAAVFLALNHPLAPLLATIAVVLLCAVVFRYAGVWLFALPACLPMMNFSPWTGWLVLEEFDLLVLGAMAGGYLRVARDAAGSNSARWPAPPATSMPRTLLASMLVFGTWGIFGLYRGVVDASPSALGWFQGYVDPLNSLRLVKPLLYAVVMLPLMQREIGRSQTNAVRLVSAGMLVGLAVVVLAVLWERAALPGLLDFSLPYRTTALFWEMHVGGAAIDAYLALATPFVVWALWSARSRAQWLGASVLALLVAYACLTTFSRGVYVGVTLPLLCLAWQLRRVKPDADSSALFRHTALGALAVASTAAVFFLAISAFDFEGAGLTLIFLLIALTLAMKRVKFGAGRLPGMTLSILLIAEGVIVLGTGSFMQQRMADSEHDFGSRTAHWRSGLSLLHSPAEWLLGIGLGRLPASYARFVARGEFSGDVQPVQIEPGRTGVRLLGPKTLPGLGGLYSLTQRVPMQSGAAHRVDFDVRMESPVSVFARLCEMHLLYARRCQSALIHLSPGDGAAESLGDTHAAGRSGSGPAGTWQHIALPLVGPALSQGYWYAPRMAVFELSVLSAGGAAEFGRVGLHSNDQPGLLRNADFSRGLASWFPAAKKHFLPWHIDNLYLELLIERGVPGLIIFLSLMGTAFWCLLCGHGRRAPIAPFLAASLCGVLTVGLVSSVMDVPRVAFLLFFLGSFSILLNGETRGQNRAP